MRFRLSRRRRWIDAEDNPLSTFIPWPEPVKREQKEQGNCPGINASLQPSPAEKVISDLYFRYRRRDFDDD